MATKKFWIQIENNPWDMNPHNINRMTGATIAAGDKTLEDLFSPVTLVTRANVEMNQATEALILRRYQPDWAAPDDRKVNPWDSNEPNPTDTGTMGTIPGATIACNVGDDVIVYFRNMDSRGKPPKERAHSLHPHGIVFAAEHDGAYPLSPPDLGQPVGAEAALWSAVGVTGFKQGDRVPPGGTFTYRWNTFGWPSTAGVWLYHDHSICDHHNVLMGAIGTLVIHNPADADDVPDQDLPDGNFNGSPTVWCPLRFRDKFPLAKEGLRAVSPELLEEINADLAPHCSEKASEEASAKVAPALRADQVFEFNRDLIQLDKNIVIAWFRRCYRPPPKKALYLQLYHEMEGRMAINGRQWLGNTPTLVGGTDTKMRFGLVAMNNLAFHTFHLHAHRWVIPGPSGGNVGGDVPPPGTGVQVSPRDVGVSPFEDTRDIGPAQSFSFTINQGSFMGPPLGGGALGEWHMHCHVLNHMMGGMMGSLLIVENGQVVTTLPRGEPCPTDAADGDGVEGDAIDVEDNYFDPGAPPALPVRPAELLVASGTVVTFNFNGNFHTVTFVSRTGTAETVETPGGIEINGGNNTAADSGVAVPSGTVVTRTVTGGLGNELNYMCGIHGAGMSGKIVII